MTAEANAKTQTPRPPRRATLSLQDLAAEVTPEVYVVDAIAMCNDSCELHGGHQSLGSIEDVRLAAGALGREGVPKAGRLTVIQACVPESRRLSLTRLSRFLSAQASSATALPPRLWNGNKHGARVVAYRATA